MVLEGNFVSSTAFQHSCAVIPVPMALLCSLQPLEILQEANLG